MSKTSCIEYASLYSCVPLVELLYKAYRKSNNQ